MEGLDLMLALRRARGIDAAALFTSATTFLAAGLVETGSKPRSRNAKHERTSPTTENSGASCNLVADGETVCPVASNCARNSWNLATVDLAGQLQTRQTVASGGFATPQAKQGQA